MARKFIRGAAALTAVAALSFGATGVASAQGSLDSVLGSSKNADLAVAKGEKKFLGEVGGPVYAVNVHSQRLVSGDVAPGSEFTVRVEVVGKTKAETRIDELSAWMPQGFTLSKVQTIQGGLLGDSVTTLNQSQYGNNVESGKQVVRVSLKEGLIFKTGVKVSPSKPLVVDFTWKAPTQEGEYKNGAGARVGSAINPDKTFDNAEPVVVKKGASTGGGNSAGSLDISSVLGSLKLG